MRLPGKYVSKLANGWSSETPKRHNQMWLFMSIYAKLNPTTIHLTVAFTQYVLVFLIWYCHGVHSSFCCTGVWRRCRASSRFIFGKELRRLLKVKDLVLNIKQKFRIEKLSSNIIQPALPSMADDIIESNPRVHYHSLPIHYGIFSKHSNSRP